jgi:translation initiation factor 4G
MTDDPEEEKRQKKFKGLINKLTVDNFDAIFETMLEVEVTSVKTLNGFVGQIFNKALAETVFCELYANLCLKLHENLPQCVALIEVIGFGPSGVLT